MAGGVGADGPLLPVRRRAALVMQLQRLGIIGAVVAEHGAAGVQTSAVAHQPVPHPVADLMAEMAEQGAVGLVHLRAHLLAIGIVGLADGDGDDTVIMPGQHLRSTWMLVEEVEHQSLDGVVHPVRQCDAEPYQRVEQPVLGGLQLAPELYRLSCGTIGRGDVRNGPVVPAGATEILSAASIHQPVAGVMLGVEAEPDLAVLHGGGGKAIPIGFQRGQRGLGREIAQ